MHEVVITALIEPEAVVIPTLQDIHAVGAGMDWLAVSDLNAAELSSFVEKLARNE